MMILPLVACDPGKTVFKDEYGVPRVHAARHVSPDSQTDGRGTARIR